MYTNSWIPSSEFLISILFIKKAKQKKKPGRGYIFKISTVKISLLKN